jgi:chromosome partitioning protein
MIVVVAALKGGVGKTTTSVYLAAVAASNRRAVTLIDADPQGSAADWVEHSADEQLKKLTVVEAPTDRLVTKALDRLDSDVVAIIDTAPGNERLLGKVLDRAAVAVVPARVGGIEAPRVEAVLGLVPEAVPRGLVITSARTTTRDYQHALETWSEAGVPVWGTVPERVAIASGPTGWLSLDGLEAYRGIWRKVSRVGTKRTNGGG